MTGCDEIEYHCPLHPRDTINELAEALKKRLRGARLSAFRFVAAITSKIQVELLEESFPLRGRLSRR